MANYTLATCGLPKKTFCLPVILKLILYLSKLSFGCLQLSTFVKNRDKFVFLLPFYVSLLSKHKNIKIQEKRRSKS